MNGLILILSLIWGFNFVIMKLGNTVFPPVLFAAFRFSLGAVVLFAIAYFKKVPLPNKRDLKWYIVCGLLQTTYLNVAIQISMNYISAGLTSVLTYSMPLFLSIMAHFWLPGDRLTVRKSTGVIVGIVGLVLAMDIRLGGNFWALGLALTAALAWATTNIIIKRHLQNCDNLQFTTWQMAIGAVGLFVYSGCFENGQVQWGIRALGYVAFAGIVASSLGFVLWFQILSKIEASKAAISLLLVPIIGVISSYLVLGEHLRPVALIGIVLVLAGIWIVNSTGTLRKEVAYEPQVSSKYE